MKLTEFPILEISKLAEKESWRKEINRPIYHLHKWWAQRLGSVFRAILIHLLKSPGKSVWDMFYENNRFDKIILDPFMGSGTTLGEALKLGSRVIGCDINPISTFLVSQELTNVSLPELDRQMEILEQTVAPEIRKYYITIDPETHSEIPVLYYFWVKLVRTPKGETIPLFANYVFSKNVYPLKKPFAQIICPTCWDIFSDRYDSIYSICPSCKYEFNPQIGTVKGAYVYDKSGKKYKIKSLLPENKQFEEKMYALLALKDNGNKQYLRITEFDISLYNEATLRIKSETLPLPQLTLRPGHNTDQARGYNYLNWRDFFNSRQLLCLGLLLKEILKINDIKIREQFLCLFSGTLEFNNMFCSYKGEGTGAVRPIFSNHILKPEKMPLENSIWGTEKSSGCFSTLYKSRLIPAKKYLDNPFEIRLNNDQCQKVTSSKKLNPSIVSNWMKLADTEESALVLCGDSAKLPLPDDCIDMVVTDPPYFDYVHYSELSDFFYAWLSPILKKQYPYFAGESSGRANEVQHTLPEEFTNMLCRVFKECYRVMKHEAKLCFSFHHAHPKGWCAIAEAIINAGFYIEEIFPVHAELMASTPKAGTKEPISLDVILVCTKHKQPVNKYALNIALKYLKLFEKIPKTLSRSDVFVMYAAQSLVNCVNTRKNKQEILQQLENDLINSTNPGDYHNLKPIFKGNVLPINTGALAICTLPSHRVLAGLRQLKGISEGIDL